MNVARFSGGRDAQLGDSATLFGDIAAAGGPYPGESRDQPGIVEVFDREPLTGIWNRTAKLSPSDIAAAAPSRFGDSVSVSHNAILVGAPLDSNEGGLSKGATYIFEKAPSTGEWVEVKKLVPPDSEEVINFSHDVFIADNVAFICATILRIIDFSKI